MKYNGEIAGFPVEIVEKMLEYQFKQRHVRDVKVFEKSKTNGFIWADTPEGHCFWYDVINNENFDRFFEKYPKQAYPKVMLVSDKNDIKKARKRVVIMNKNSKYIAWMHAETLEEAEKEYSCCCWNFAWDLPKEDNIIELTLEDIAMLKGVDVNRIRIKD